MSKKNKKAETTTGRKNISKRQDITRRFLRNRNSVIGLVVTAIFVFVALFAPILVDYDTQVIQQDIPNRLLHPGEDPDHPLGTDELGRDVMARLIYAAKMSLAIGAMAVIIAIAIGVVIGASAGYFGGRVDTILMRIMEVLDGVPSFLMALTICASLGASVYTLMIAIAVGSIAAQSRIVRSAVLTVKNNEYVEAAKAMGASDMQIIFYHIIPNCVGTIIVQFSVKIAGGILHASSLSFLGLGVQPPDPEWGAMLSGGRAYMLDNPTLTLFPGLCIMVVILAFNMLGDGLRDSLDPRLKG
ncbi:MAG: ABC transporter permease [Firmicutes bacterium]|nr:ABC transporter permease [Bacillota bacterium]